MSYWDQLRLGTIYASVTEGWALLPNGEVVGGGRRVNGPMAGVEHATQVDNHCALLGNGTIARWSNYGILDVPVPGIDNAIQISAYSSQQGLALLDDGTIAGWGGDNYGQVSGANGITNAVQVAMGLNYGLALLDDGTIAGWGIDDYGQVSGANGITGAVQISAGERTAAAVLSDGSLVGWGYNSWGQADPPPLTTPAVQVSMAGDYGIALLNDGTVVAWGAEAYGRVLDATSITGAIQVSASYDFALAVLVDGTIVGWGRDNFQQVTLMEALGSGGIATEPTYTLSGITALPDGTPVSARLRAYHAETGKLVWEKTSSPVDGSYDFRLPRRWSAYVQCEYDTGHRPLVHGPITPPPEV